MGFVNLGGMQYSAVCVGDPSHVLSVIYRMALSVCLMAEVFKRLLLVETSMKQSGRSHSPITGAKVREQQQREVAYSVS